MASPPEQIDDSTTHLGAGLVIEDDPRLVAPADPVVEVWETHWIAFRLFSALYGQWRMGPGGPVALDYLAIDPVARLLGIKPADTAVAFPALQVMEGAALNTIHERAQRELQSLR